MAENIIYGPQEWTASDISNPTYYRSTTHGGSDAPISGYPELAELEAIQRVENAGPNSEHVMDLNTQDYSIMTLRMLAMGPLANGEYDARDLWVRWKHKLTQAGFDDSGGYNTCLMLTHGGLNHDGGLFAVNIFLEVYIDQSSGYNFNWGVAYRRAGNTGIGQGNYDMVGSEGASGVVDDTWHEIKIHLTPSTVTDPTKLGVPDPPGSTPSQGVESDGAFELYVDDVLVHSATGLKWVINYYQTTAPECYYGRGVWHGD